MRSAETLLARKYARALQEAIIDEFDHHKRDALERWSLLLKNRVIIKYLRLDVLSDATKADILIQTAHSYGLDFSWIRSLLKLLQKQGRLYLVGYVLYELVVLSHKSYGIEDVEVTTVDALTNEEKKAIQRIVCRHTGAREVRIKERRDPSLIAGLRLQGKEFLWEYSVRNQLAALEKMC